MYIKGGNGSTDVVLSSQKWLHKYLLIYDSIFLDLRVYYIQGIKFHNSIWYSLPEKAGHCWASETGSEWPSRGSLRLVCPTRGSLLATFKYACHNCSQVFNDRSTLSWTVLVFCFCCNKSAQTWLLKKNTQLIVLPF